MYKYGNRPSVKATKHLTSNLKFLTILLLARSIDNPTPGKSKMIVRLFVSDKPQKKQSRYSTFKFLPSIYFTVRYDIESINRLCREKISVTSAYTQKGYVNASVKEEISEAHLLLVNCIHRRYIRPIPIEAYRQDVIPTRHAVECPRGR